jgi:ribonuclease-3
MRGRFAAKTGSATSNKRTALGTASATRACSLYFPGVDNGLAEFEQRIGYTFARRELLRRALTHKSFSHESKEDDVRHNETFEFLGDSVLGFVIGDLLFHEFPSLDEGALSKMKAHLVSAATLAAKSRHYEMGDVILLGVGEEKTGGRKKDSLLANLFEAVIAAIYLDGGVEPARTLIVKSFMDDIKNIDQQDLLFRDYKTALQELAQGRGLQLPEYKVIDEVGPDHGKTFIIEVKVGSLTARGEGTSKKEAQQQAAKQAMRDFAERYG